MTSTGLVRSAEAYKAKEKVMQTHYCVNTRLGNRHPSYAADDDADAQLGIIVPPFA
jgi:hypothetical protein